MGMRGFAQVGAMVLVSELGGAWRFAHPRQLMAYLGLVPSEQSSGSRIGLHDGVVGEPGQAARRLAGRQRHELGQHRARDAECHSGDTGRVEALHGKSIERAALAAQRGVLACGAERLGHENVVDAIGIRRRAAQPDRAPGVE